MNLRIKNKKLKEKLKFYEAKPVEFNLIRQKVETKTLKFKFCVPDYFDEERITRFATYALSESKEFAEYLHEHIKKSNVPFVKDGWNGYEMRIRLIIDHENMD